MRQYSLRTLMLTVTVFCVATTAWVQLGVIGAAYFLLLLGAYWAGSLLPLRICALCLAVTLFFCLLPWLGAGIGTFIVPGAETCLPTFEMEGTLPDPVHNLLRLSYQIAEVPLHFFALLDSASEGVFYFPSGDRVRPFSFFVFWSGFAAFLACSTLLRTRRRVRAGRQMKERRGQDDR